MNQEPAGGLPTTEYWYSCQPFLAWCINHYFYGGEHYAYLARPFHPYRENNPRSSNPLRIYESLYEAYRDGDRYDKLVAELRLGLHKGLRQNEPRLGSGVCARLLVVVDRIGPPFFLPIVYRVDPGAIDRSGGEQQGSGLTGSREYLVADLREDEFQVIVFDVATPEDAITQLARGDLSAAEVLGDYLNHGAESADGLLVGDTARRSSYE